MASFRRRQGVVVFVDLARWVHYSAQLTLEEQGERLQEFYQRTGEILAYHGGRGVKAVGDAVIGLLPPGGVVEAALALTTIRAHQRARGMDVKAGIARGEFLQGRFGPRGACHGDILGPPVSRAASLSNRVRSGIAAEAGLRDELAVAFRLRSLPGGEVRVLGAL